ncbi:lantibiotic dehydratase [Streptomyces melanogenes]|uniref:lantibiotic dehydratase n=1 Tax=Streptomyces melanogenes TaxID=67326 RepID=UPI0037AAF2E0
MGGQHGTQRDSHFTAVDPVLLRAPARPLPEHPDSPAGPTEADLARYVAEAALDPLLREAVELSSPSLARLLAADRPLAGDALRRAATAVGRYRLRMTTRPTPFGLLAGVGLARFGEAASVRWGGHHRASVRSDLGWLAKVVKRLHQDPAVLPGLLLVADQQCVVRGSRLVLPYVPRDGDDTLEEVSVRHTPVVAEVLRNAASPVAFAKLVAGVSEAFPTAPSDAVVNLVRTLVARGFLHTDLFPAPDSTDPLGHVRDRLPEDLPLRGELEGIRSELLRCEDLEAGGDGARLKALQVAREHMTALCPSDHVLHVDLVLDADVVLPEAVREEFERAATALWRLSPPRTAPAHLRAYHRAFVERYGMERAVPVTELLDPADGLGPPDGYEHPAVPRPGADAEPHEGDLEDVERRRLLAELAAGALADLSPGAPLPEVVLNGALFARLAGPDPDGTAANRLPDTLELYAELVGESAGRLDSGKFRIALSPVVGSDVAGATFGRFAAELGGPELMARVSGAQAPMGGDGEPVPVHLEFTPVRPRHANIARTPRWLGHRVVVSAFPEAAGPEVLSLDDLVVHADPERLSIRSRSLGRPVRVTAHHVLNKRTGAPNVARFLHEVGRLSGHRLWQPWDWGTAATNPALPRVRYGRTILAPASWRLTLSTAAFEEWCAALPEWRRRWGVPASVRLVTGDQRITLDLDLPWHQRLLYAHARTAEATLLQEDPAAAGTGWLRSPEGAHTAELVVALHAREQPAPRPQMPPMAVRRTPQTVSLPGGDWLYARVDIPQARQDTVIEEWLPQLAAALPAGIDRWFFIRYRDPQPHLRIRFHGESPARTADLLTVVRDWAAELRAAHLASGLRLETYDPELERYGGPEAMAAAERVFHADSLVALSAGAARGLPGPDRDLFSAVNTADIARHFLAGAGGPPADVWLPAAYPKSEHDHRAFRDNRAAVLRAIGPDGPAPAFSSPELALAWQWRAARLADHGALLAELRERDPDRMPPAPVAGSLIHMSHNRLIGIDPQAERRALALARGAFEAHRARRRAQEQR